MMVQRLEPTVRYVSVEGPVARIDPGSHDRSWEMAARYLPSDQVAEFVEHEKAQLGEHATIYMQPAHWLSADMGSLG